MRNNMNGNSLENDIQFLGKLHGDSILKQAGK